MAAALFLNADELPVLMREGLEQIRDHKISYESVVVSSRTTKIRRRMAENGRQQGRPLQSTLDRSLQRIQCT